MTKELNYFKDDTYVSAWLEEFKKFSCYIDDRFYKNELTEDVLEFVISNECNFIDDVESRREMFDRDEEAWKLDDIIESIHNCAYISENYLIASQAKKTFASFVDNTTLPQELLFLIKNKVDIAVEDCLV